MSVGNRFPANGFDMTYGIAGQTDHSIECSTTFIDEFLDIPLPGFVADQTGNTAFLNDQTVTGNRCSGVQWHVGRTSLEYAQNRNNILS